METHLFTQEDRLDKPNLPSRIGRWATKAWLQIQGAESEFAARYASNQDEREMRRRGTKFVAGLMAGAAALAGVTIWFEKTSVVSNGQLERIEAEIEACVESIDPDLPNAVKIDVEDRCREIGLPASTGE